VEPVGPRPAPSLEELEAKAVAAIRALLWLDLETVLEARRSVKERFSTGLPSVDAKIEGGLYAGTLTVVQGKPGIGKTMLATQIALELSSKCAVACLYADEGMQGAAVRIGQQLGVPRAKLMDGEGIATASLLIGRSPFFRFLDPSHADSTVEFMFEEFDRMAPKDMQRVYLVDSAQVVRSLRVTTKHDRRQAISMLLVQLRELALKYRAIVIVVSQVGRGSYRSKNEDERIDPLAAGLESSAIEFMADLILHLDGKPTKEDPAVKLRCPKNRLSAEGSFEVELAMDFPRSRFIEADPAAVEAARVIAREDENRATLADIVKAISTDYADEGASANQIVKDMQPRRRVDVLDGIRYGLTRGVLRREKRTGKGGGWLHFVKV
jgi:KaiC/GvpD/RAD55 family RecA-like ATPase